MNMNNIDFKQFLQIKENKNKGIPELPKRNTKLVTYTLLVDSRDRDRSVFSNSNNFRVKINSGDQTDATVNFKYKNIKEIKLISAIFPKRISSHPYIILDIEELNNEQMKGTNYNLNNCFAIIIPEQHDNPGDFVNCSVNYLESQKHTYNPPLATLPNTLTFNIKHPDGSLTDLGIDNVLPNAPKESVQCFFVFKIICEEEDTSILNPRII